LFIKKFVLFLRLHPILILIKIDDLIYSILLCICILIMYQLPTELRYMIYKECLLKILFNLTKMNKLFLQEVQSILYNFRVNYDRRIKLYDITKIRKLKNDCDLENKDVKLLTELEELDLSKNKYITDEGIKNLINLQHLYLISIDQYNFGKVVDNNKITDYGIKNLINLKSLVTNNNITNH